MDNLGHLDFGEKGGKKLVAVHKNEDGTMDFETDDGAIYRNCVIKNWNDSPSDDITETETETANFSVDIENIRTYKENFLEALGFEEEKVDLFAAKMQVKSLDITE